MSERNPGGDRGGWSPSAWPDDPADRRDPRDPPDPDDDGSPGASIFGPITNDRYPQPHWPGETDGPGSSVFEPTAPTPVAPSTPRYPGAPGRQAHIPPPTPPTAPQYPQYPPTAPQYPPEPYPEPTRPQPRMPDRGAPLGRPRRGRDDRTPPRQDRPYDDRGRDGGRDRDRGRGGGGRGFPLGAGFLFGASGLACFLLALLVLPWFEVGGREVTLADIRQSFSVAATDPDTLPGADGGSAAPETPTDVVEDQARDVGAQLAASAIDSGRARYLEIYTETLWLVLAVGVSLAVLFSTILSPRSTVLSLLLGFRRLSGLFTFLAILVHGAALWVVFNGTNAPDPAFGVWLGLGGLGAVFLGCILGPKR